MLLPAALASTEEEVIGLNRNLQLAALGLNLIVPPLPQHVFLLPIYLWRGASLDYSSTLKNWEASRENLASLERLEGIATPPIWFLCRRSSDAPSEQGPS